MKISYAITVCNEFQEIQRLINFLIKNKRSEDEVVILFDSVNGTSDVEEFLRAKSVNGEFNWIPYKFDGHFANMKNRLTDMCTGDYIFQIDADEVPNKTLINHLPEVLELNDVEVLRVSRVNTVEGLTKKHIDEWGWIVSDSGKVNWPDPQWRIYKNDPKIRWKNKVHEVLDGYTTKADLPYLEEWALYHPKTIERQEKQNEYYNTL
jgi:GT2 family glycosyltransferase